MSLTDAECRKPPYFIERQKYLDCQKTRGIAITIGIVFIIIVISIFSIIGGASVLKTLAIGGSAALLTASLILLAGPSSSASTWDMHHSGLLAFAAARGKSPDAVLSEYHEEQMRIEYARRAAEAARRRPPPPPGNSFVINL